MDAGQKGKSSKSTMNRRAGATDRHALLAGGAYPSSSSLSAYRSSSPYDSNPYASTSNSNGSSSYHSSDFVGAPKKEPPVGSQSSYGDGIFGRAASAYSATRTAEDLEEQNDQRLEGLTARVSMLKEITLNIGTEVRESTKDLGTLGEAFESTSAFLGGTFKRMNKMAKRQGGWFCNMMLFLLFVTWLFVSVDSTVVLAPSQKLCVERMLTCPMLRSSLCLVHRSFSGGGDVDPPSLQTYDLLPSISSCIIRPLHSISQCNCIVKPQNFSRLGPVLSLCTAAGDARQTAIAQASNRRSPLKAGLTTTRAPVSLPERAFRFDEQSSIWKKKERKRVSQETTCNRKAKKGVRTTKKGSQGKHPVFLSVIDG